MQSNVVINQRKYVVAPTDTEVITAGRDKGGSWEGRGGGGEKEKKDMLTGGECHCFFKLFLYFAKKEKRCGSPSSALRIMTGDFLHEN